MFWNFNGFDLFIQPNKNIRSAVFDFSLCLIIIIILLAFSVSYTCCQNTSILLTLKVIAIKKKMPRSNLHLKLLDSNPATHVWGEAKQHLFEVTAPKLLNALTVKGSKHMLHIGSPSRKRAVAMFLHVLRVKAVCENPMQEEGNVGAPISTQADLWNFTLKPVLTGEAPTEMMKRKCLRVTYWSSQPGS